MKNVFPGVVSVACFLFLMMLQTPIFAESITADDLASKVYNRDVGQDMQQQGTMTLISESGQKRVRELESMRLDSTDSRDVIIRFKSPADIAGTGFLVQENTKTEKTQQHLYLPSIQRTRRIVSSQMSRSFVNSDFSYEDMQRHPLSEWSYQLGEEKTLLGRPCYQLISTAKESTETQYSRFVSFIDKEYFLPLETLFYDKKGTLLKQYTVHDFKLISGIATEISVTMETVPEHHTTEMKTLGILYNKGLKQNLFTTAALEK
jgi:hypothetical protein